jgi:hypothetical protein
MPLYSIQGPDGKTYSIEGPEGATKEQIVDAIQYKLASQPKVRQNKGFLADVGTDIKRGVEQIPGMLTGLADIPVGLVTGKPYVGKAADYIGEATGFQPSKWQEEAAKKYSPERQAQEQAIAEAEGFVGTGKAYLQNPRALAGVITEALPATVAGGAAGRILGSAAKIGSPAARAGIGEGAVGAGMTMDTLTQGGENAEDVRRKALASAGAGAFTGLIGAKSAKLGERFGITDPESIFNRPMVQNLSQTEIDTFMNAANRGIASRVGIGALKEGVIEELPQSVQEQMFQNWAERKPIMENVDKAAITGLLAGAGMGGGFNAISKGMSQDDIRTELERRRVANAKSIQENLDRMATEAMGGTRESRPLETIQAQAAAAEREVDVAGANKVAQDYADQLNEIRKRQDSIAQTTAAVLADRPDLSLAHVMHKTDSPEGIQELMKNFDDYFYFENKKDAAELRTMLQQQLTAAKKAKTAESKLSPEEQQYYAMAQAYDLLEISTQDELRSRPLEQLEEARAEMEMRMADAKLPKSKQPLYTQIMDMLEDAIENNTVAEPEVAPTPKPRVLTREDMRLAQEKAALLEQGPEQVEIPDEAFQQPTEVMPSAEELFAKQQADEAAAFELQEQYAQPEAAVEEGEQVNEPVPAGQKALFTKTGAPTRDALRGAPIKTTNGATIRQGDIDSDELLNQQRATEAEDIEGVGRPALGTDRRTDTRPAVGSERGDVAGGSTLAEVKSAIGEVDKLAKLHKVELPEDIVSELLDLNAVSNMPKNKVKPWATQANSKIKEARNYILAESAARRTNELKQLPGFDEFEAFTLEELGDFGFDPDTNMYSKKKAKGEPKQVPSKVREDSKEATTVERLQNTVKGWFNPVWYNNAIKNGWLQIIDGTINDSDLSDKVKEANQDAKAVFTPNGKVYLFAANIPKGNELGVILHEIGEHKGLENLIGKDRVVQLANRVREMAKGKGKDAEIAQRAMQMAEGERASDKELIAYFGEIAINNYGMKPGGKNKPEFGKAIGWLNELWSSLSKALATFHINPAALKGQDVVDMLYGAARLEMGTERLNQVEQEAEEADVMASRIQQLSPEEDQLLRDMGVKPFRVKGKETVRDQMVDLMGGPMTFRDWMDRFGTKVVGPLYAISRKMSAAYGPESFYNKETGKFHGHLAAQHSLNSMYFASGAVREGTLEIDPKTGAPVITAKEDNIPKLVENYDALRKAIEADGNSPAMSYQLASFAILADRYKALQKIGQKTGAEFPEASYKLGKEVQDKYTNEFNTWRETWNGVRQNKRQALIASGLYTPKEVDTLLERLEYVPLYRIKDSEGMDAVFMRNLLSANYEQKLQFGTEGYDVADVMGNILKNEMWLYQRIMKNNTSNLLADDLELMEKDFGDAFGGHYVSPINKDQPNVYAFLRDGELKYFKINNSNDAAMFESVPVINNTAMRIGNIIGATLRRGITVTPSFWYRQAWQDAERAWMQGGSKQSFLKSIGTNVSEQFKNISKESPLAADMRKLGLVGQVDFQDSFDHWMENILGRTDDSWMGKANKLIEKAERMAQNSDLAARASVYKAALDEVLPDGVTKRYTKQEAALKAQMMINYNHKGTSSFLRYMLATVPFVNAKIQSDWRLVDALKGNMPGVTKEQARQLLMMKVAKFAAFTMLYAMARSGDDDYEDASDENRDRNFLLGGIKVPVSPEYLALKAAVEHTYRSMSDQEFETPEKFRHAMKSGAMNLITSPTDIMPSLVKPMIENMANYSFFTDRALVGPSLANKDTNMQYVKGQTSELAKFFSDIGQSVLGNDLNASPIKIDNFIRGFFGSMGQDVLFASNMIADGLSDVERPAAKLNQLPEIGAAFYDPQGSQRKGDYYQLRDKAEARYNTFLDLRKTNPERAREYREEHKALINMMPALNAIGNQLENIRARRNRIMESPAMDGETKREELDKLAVLEKRLIGNRVQKLRERLE